MKELYEAPQSEWIRFSQEDVIVTSGETLETGETTPIPGGDEWD